VAQQQFYFAWVGGPAVPGFTLAATGDVWGGQLTAAAQTWGGQLRTSGDIQQGSGLVVNILDATGLVAGRHYSITGKGLGSAESLNGMVYNGGRTGQLDFAATETATAETFILSTDEGRDEVFLDRLTGLVVGQVYDISGSGLASGTQFTFGGSSPVTITSQATTTGVGVPVKIASTLDRNVVKNLSSTAGLDTSTLYEVLGQGIPAGATGQFDGTDKIVMLTEATVTGQAVPLSIRKGVTYPDGGPFDPTVHLRKDEQLVSLEIMQSEGDFATLSVTIQNPRVGLLGGARQRWCWLSWDDGSVVHPLLHGRLVGVPANFQSEVITLEFIARPEDYFAQKAALARGMRDLPHWDPVWLIEHVADDDTVLEARTQDFHIDRVTLEVTTSDIISGEDGTLELSEAQSVYSEVHVSILQSPLRRVNVTANVEWDQAAEGDVDLTDALWGAFQAVGSAGPWPLITSFTGDGLFTSWPQPLTSIGGGWEVGLNSVIVPADWVNSKRYAVKYLDKSVEAKATQDKTSTGTITTYEPPVIPTRGTMVAAGWKLMDVDFEMGVYSIFFEAHYSASRKRSEVVTFSLEADVQAVLTEPGAMEEENLSFSSSFVSQPVDLGGATPIGDVRRNSYFKTDRGQQSFEFLVLLARAKLLARARAVQVRFVTSWAVAVDISCRMNVTLADRRFPGGSVTGKVVAYKLVLDQGTMRSEVTIGCTVGHGTSVVEEAGVPVYVDEGYVVDGYQVEKGGKVVSQTGDITFQPFDDFDVIDDDGVDFFNMEPSTVLRGISVLGGLTEQRQAIDADLKLPKPNPVAALKNTPTRVVMDLIPVTGGDFLSFFNVLVDNMAVPKTIDLEA
jgi:hypothetical protein